MTIVRGSVNNSNGFLLHFHKGEYNMGRGSTLNLDTIY
jgi:hypothetical protein